MRTKKIINALGESKDEPFVYEPSLTTVLENDKVGSKVVVYDPCEFMSQFKTTDFELGNLLESGVDPEKLGNPKLMSVNRFEFANYVESLNIG